MYQFTLPDLGEGIAEVEVVEWLVREGDVLHEDQPIVTVQTDKALLEIPSPRGGRVHRLGAPQGAILAVGKILLEIDDGIAGAGASTAPPLAQAPSAPSPQPEEPPQERPRRIGVPPNLPPRPIGRPARPEPPGRRADAVPAVREFAKQLGIDLELVTGTGPGGRVMRRDVEAYAAAQQHGEPEAGLASVRPTPDLAEDDQPDWRRQPLRGVRRLTAERMTRAKATIPHYTFVEEVDLTLLEERRQAAAQGGGEEPLSPLAFIAHTVVRTLARFPHLNACLDDETAEIILKGKIHLGIAVATDDGLVVPVIPDAGSRQVAELAAAIRDLAERARARRLAPGELRGATFTITSLGKLGGVMATPIINYPASAILGVHAIRLLPRYVAGALEPRRVVNLSLSLDHRIVDGFEAARFVQEVKDVLERADFPGHV